MNGRLLFVTGTGTGVGKTIATAALIVALRRSGLDAVPAKPIQTGAPGGPETAPDLVYTFRAAGLPPEAWDPPTMVPVCHAPACSPHLAARLAGTPIELPPILAAMEKLRRRHDVVVAEGAGGIFVPLDEKRTMLDLAAAFGCPIVIVATTGLGTINHTLLTASAILRRKLPIAGILFTQHAAPADAEEAMIADDNPATICGMTGLTNLGVIPPLGDVADPVHFPGSKAAAAITGLDDLRRALHV
jgi:dethiobiotin synthetase